MSIEIDGVFVLLALLIPAGLVVALATAPRWAIRSMSKHAMWRLRDDVVDDVRAGRLPAEHQAVRELIERVEWAIREARSFDFLHFYVWSRARRKLPSDSVRKMEKIVTLDGLSKGHRERIERYRTRYNTVAIRAILLSSWMGMAVLLRFSLPATRAFLRQDVKQHKSIGSVVWVATNDVASDTNIGQRAREFVTEKGPQAEPAAV